MQSPDWHTGILLPYGTSFVNPGTLAGSIRLGGGALELRFELAGPLDQVRLPPRAEHPARRHELWQHTCFEAFVSPPRAGHYWEINLSPSGDWNVYRFDAYRDGQTDPLLEGPVAVAASYPRPFTFMLEARLPAPEGLAGAGELDVGLTAVVETVTGAKTYWALSHRGEKPDFHLRDSFVMRLA